MVFGAGWFCSWLGCVAAWLLWVVGWWRWLVFAWGLGFGAPVLVGGTGQGSGPGPEAWGPGVNGPSAEIFGFP